MITVYLNSLYNLLFGQNFLLVWWQSVSQTFKTFRNIRKNRTRVQAKIIRLETNLNQFESAMLRVNPTQQHVRLDTYR